MNKSHSSFREAAIDKQRKTGLINYELNLWGPCKRLWRSLGVNRVNRRDWKETDHEWETINPLKIEMERTAFPNPGWFWRCLSIALK